jgi:hypothetical protein
MNEEIPQPITRAWYRRNIVLFIGGSIVVAFLLVLASMALYATSGAAQLDLSRPGYKSVQDKVDRTDNFESFPATGSVDGKTLDQFLELYTKQTKPVDDNNAFNPSALDDSALEIESL